MLINLDAHAIDHPLTKIGERVALGRTKHGVASVNGDKCRDNEKKRRHVLVHKNIVDQNLHQVRRRKAYRRNHQRQEQSQYGEVKVRLYVSKKPFQRLAFLEPVLLD
jgi:hypothetical protein